MQPAGRRPNLNRKLVRDSGVSYAEAAEWHEALATGRHRWFERFGEAELPVGVSPTEAAIDKAREIADECRERLPTKIGTGTA